MSLPPKFPLYFYALLFAALLAQSLGHAAPISYWTLDDGAGIVAVNSVPGGPNADLRNGPTWVAGRFGNAISFDGANDYLGVAQNISETAHTVSMWVKTSAGGSLFSVNQPEQGGANDRNVWMSGGNITGRVWQNAGDESITTSGTSFADGAWHHVVHQYGAAIGHRLFVDGQLRAPGTKTLSDFNWQTHLEIGWSNYAPNYFNGVIDDVAVWNETLPERYIRFMAAGNTVNSVPTATANWTGGVGPWEAGANWSTSPAVPGASHDTFVANGGTAQITAGTGTASPGMLTIGGTGAGTVALSGGTLSTQSLGVGANGTLAVSGGTLAVPAIGLEAASATLGFSNAGPMALSIPITGPGALTKAGAGTTTLQGAGVAYTGPTTLSGGTLKLTDATAFASSAITDNATLEIEVTSGSQTFSRPISGTGGLVKSGPGGLLLNSSATYGGPTVVAGGTLKLGLYQPVAGRAFWLDASQAGTLTTDGTGKVSVWQNLDNATQTVSQGSAGAQPTLLSAASGINGLPAVRFNLGGVQTYLLSDTGDYANYTDKLTVFMVGRQSGGQVVTYPGLMSMVDSWTNPDHDRAVNAIPFLQNAGTANTWGTWRQGAAKGFGTIPAASTPFIAATAFDGAFDRFYVNGSLQGSAASSGSFGINYFSVGSRYYSGTLKERWNGDLGELLIYNRVLSDGERDSVTAYLTAKWLTSGSSPDVNRLPATTALAIAAGATLDLNGVSQTVASLADYAGGGGQVINTATGPVTFTLNPSAGATTFSGAIGGGGGGAVALVKNGAGTQVLSGTNTYAGGTTINAGVLRVDGSIVGPVDVNGGWLLGSGTVNGAVTVDALAGISAGASPGHLTIVGTYLQAGTMLVELAGLSQGTQYDWIEVVGSADLSPGSVIDLNFVPPFVAKPGDYFDVLTATGGITGFNALTFDFGGANAGWGWVPSLESLVGGGQALRLTLSPEPASFTLLALGGLALLRRRRRKP